jgi:hypothetical protein
LKLKVKEYPDNINDLPVEMIKDIDIKELKNLFLNLVMDIMEKIKNKNKFPCKKLVNSSEKNCTINSFV